MVSPKKKARKKVAKRRTAVRKSVRRRLDPVPTHPGAVLRLDVLPALDMTVTAVAEAMGISRMQLHRILAETHPVTPDMAILLGEFCGNGPELWANMQSAYDIWQAKKRMRAKVRNVKRPKLAKAA